MKSKLHDDAGDGRRGSLKTENSPVRPNTRVTGHRSGGVGQRSKVSSSSSSPGPRLGPAADRGAGRTPQTKRRELSLTVLEKNSPTGSPRNVSRTGSSGVSSRKSNKTKSDNQRDNVNNTSEESSRKSSNSSQDSGIGRESKQSRDKVRSSLNKSLRAPPIITTTAPDRVENEVSGRKRFEELCDIKNIELGMVKVPPDILEDLINMENIEKFYDVEEKPVASGLFATVRKCTHKESGIEYAAKFSSRLRYGVDCTMEVLHEIALLSICADSSKIVHLKDVFQNKLEIILVLEYAPGGDFQSVLDEDMVPFEQDVQGFMLQLLEALSFAHERNIAHLDIKPQNIVLMSEFPNCEIKLCDLEVSRVIQDHEEIREIIGTPDYVAPEILMYEPISLAADIWSLGVLAYVLLTGFSPFGGETDQETLINITTATLDFPAELFEGVSEEAKEFIKECLNRNPKDRPSVKQCLQHAWVAGHSEPPSPSPLMLKIPAPDHFVTVSPKLSAHHSPGSTSSSRRSCQTCRDKLSERKRYLSKSREAIFEKVTNSQLKKSLSKSRERLCDMRLTLSKSREYLNDSKMAVSRSQEKFYSFKSLSKSQEVLSQGLGGNMKRTNAAVSDISPHHLPVNPRVYLDSQPDNCDFVMLPGSSVLMSHSELMSITGIRNAGSLQLLPISESGRSTPASVCSNATVADIPYSDPPNNNNISNIVNNINNIVSSNNKSVHVETLVEVAEDEHNEDDNKSKHNNREKKNQPINNKMSGRRKSKQEITPPRACSQKEEKNNINYVTKQSLAKNVGEKISVKNTTAEVAVQVDQIELTTTKTTSPPPPTTTTAATATTVVRRKDKVEKSESEQSLNFGSSDFFNVDGNIRPVPDKKLTRGFSHDNTLGISDEQKRYSWREDLEKFRSMKKPLAVSDLIDAFSTNSMQRQVFSEDPSFPNLDNSSVKNKRRGSLQLSIDPKSLSKLSGTSDEENNLLKTLRRKSTSAILPLRLTEVKTVVTNKVDEEHLSGDVSTKSDNSATNNDEKTVTDEAASVGDSDSVESSDCSVNNTSTTSCESISSPAYCNQSLPKGRIYLEKVNERKRTWDYFEINHPKAISDKKLEQLKAKYTRRKTEADISSSKSKIVDENANDKREAPAALTKSKTSQLAPTRTQSMSVFEGLVVSEAGQSLLPKKSLDLAFDPLTGECLTGDTESVDSGRESESLRKLSQDSSSEESSSRKSSRSGGGRKSSHLGDIPESEQSIPDEMVLECFIDPFTGQFITNEVAKTEDKPANKTETIMSTNKKNTSKTMTNNNVKNLKVNVERKINNNTQQQQQDDDGIGSLPITPTDNATKTLSVLKKTNELGEDDGIYTSSEDTICSATKPSCDEDESDRGSVLSSEDNADVKDGKKVGRSNSEITKVCSGSVSRGLVKFSGKEQSNTENN